MEAANVCGNFHIPPITHPSALGLRRWESAVRYALAFVIAWIGALQFTTYEATSIQPLVAGSPLMGWVYDILSATTFSAVLVVVDLVAARELLDSVGRQAHPACGQCDGNRDVRRDAQLYVHRSRCDGA